MQVTSTGCDKQLKQQIMHLNRLRYDSCDDLLVDTLEDHDVAKWRHEVLGHYEGSHHVEEDIPPYQAEP